MRPLQLTQLVVLFVLLTTVISNDYKTTVARELAFMSLATYESSSSINNWNCGPCKSYQLEKVQCDTIGALDLQWFSGHSPSLKGIVLAFRGSSNIQNWISNLNFNMVGYPNCAKCQVHNGFYTNWQAAYRPVLNRIQSLKSLYRDAPIFITGHSLGAALAVLAAADIQHLYGGVQSLITFGEPRVGNQHFSDYYQSVLVGFRVIHKADVVPHIPLTGQGFFHEGREVWYKSSMSDYKMCSYGEPGSCSNSLPLTTYNTGDHDMHAYAKLAASSSFMDFFKGGEKDFLSSVQQFVEKERYRYKKNLSEQ